MLQGWVKYYFENTWLSQIVINLRIQYSIRWEQFMMSMLKIRDRQLFIWFNLIYNHSPQWRNKIVSSKIYISEEEHTYIKVLYIWQTKFLFVQPVKELYGVPIPEHGQLVTKNYVTHIKTWSNLWPTPMHGQI